jgi:hypothetical protein
MLENLIYRDLGCIRMLDKRAPSVHIGALFDVFRITHLIVDSKHVGFLQQLKTLA